MFVEESMIRIDISSLSVKRRYHHSLVSYLDWLTVLQTIERAINFHSNPII